MPSSSFWIDTVEGPSFPPLADDLAVDVAIVGGGITGVTAAYLMRRAGLSVALLERERCASVDTGHTTAHVTHVTDDTLGSLVSTFGRDHAQAAWDAGIAAIDQIEAIVRREHIAAHFSRVPGFLLASIEDDANERDRFREEAELANELGFPATFVNAVPVFERPGVRYANQARIHPRRYLAALLERLQRGPGPKAHVFEQTEVTEFSDQGLCLEANGHKIVCRHVVIATHAPIAGKSNLASATLLQSKIAPYTSYVVGGWLPSAGRVPDALWWDTTDPYYYLRLESHEGRDYAIFGGADHKTGQQDDPAACFARLEEALRRHVPEIEIDRRWSGQVMTTLDGLPYIGETADRQFVATGYAGNGMTFGTLAAMMALDYVTGRKNPWQQLFDVHRKKLGGLWNYLLENKDYPYYMIKDRLARGEGSSLESLGRGDGAVLRLGGQLVAAARDGDGRVTTLSPVCTHMGCIVHWNGAERTWDCPCHGSRFHATGEVLGGPAESPLEPVEVEQQQPPKSASAR